MAEKLLDGATHEKIEATDIEADMKKSAADKLKAGVSQPTVAGTATPASTPAPAGPKLGVFGTLGLAWLHVTNTAIGGKEIKLEGAEPILMGVKDMDQLVVKEIMESGAELDKLYFAEKTTDPHWRYLGSIALFYMIEGRLAKVKAWWEAHRKEEAGKNDKPK